MASTDFVVYSLNMLRCTQDTLYTPRGLWMGGMSAEGAYSHEVGPLDLTPLST